MDEPIIANFGKNCITSAKCSKDCAENVKLEAENELLRNSEKREGELAEELTAENKRLKEENSYQAKIGAQQFEQLKSEGECLRAENKRLRNALEATTDRICEDCTFDDCVTEAGCPYKELFEKCEQALKGDSK